MPKYLHVRADCEVIMIALRLLLFAGISKPPAIHLVATTSSSIYICWKKPDLGDNFESITGYQIRTDRFQNRRSLPQLFVNTTTCTNITSLPSNAKYNIYVRARGESQPLYGDSSRTVGSTRT